MVRPTRLFSSSGATDGAISMSTEIFNGTVARVLAREEILRVGGYRLTTKTREQDLLPGEYFKRTYSGSDTSFQGAAGSSITWCHK